MNAWLKSKFWQKSAVLFAIIVAGGNASPGFSKIFDDESIHKRAFVLAVEDLMRAFMVDKAEIEKKTNRALVIGYSQTPNLPQDVQNTVLQRLEEAGALAPNPINLPRCIECLTVQAEIEDGDIYIKRGVTKSEDLEKYFAKYTAKAYASINLSFVGDKLILHLSIYNATDRNVIFSKTYDAFLKRILDEEVTFGVSVGLMTPKDANIAPLVGGGFSVGQYIAGVGNIGLSAGSFSNSDKNSISIFGVFANFNLNETFGRYWRFGYLTFTSNLGFAMVNSQIQLNAAPGLQLNLGTIFHFNVTYGINKKQGALNPAAPPVAKATIDPNKDIPPYIAMAVGIDL